MAGQAQKMLHAARPINGHFRVLLSDRPPPQSGKLSGKVSADEYFFSIINAIECMFRRSLPFDLPLNSHFHPQFLFSSPHSCSPFPELLGLCSAIGGIAEYLHCKQVEISRILGIPRRNADPIDFPRVDWMRDDDRSRAAECKNEYIYFREEIVQGFYSLISIDYFLIHIISLNITRDFSYELSRLTRNLCPVGQVPP